MTQWRITALAAGALVLGPRLAAQVSEQGIKVHGRWVIEVRNADGTLDARHEFDNGLFEQGKVTLANLLTGQKAFDYWQIQIHANGNICPDSPICAVAEPISPYPNFFRNLTKTVVDATLVLQGSFVAAGDGVVTRVATYTISFPPGHGLGFTTSLTYPGIPVQATQTVSVKVTFSFS